MAATTGRFEVEDGEIIDTKARQIISLDQLAKLATPDEQDSIRQQIQDSGWAGADQSEGSSGPALARGTVSRPSVTDTPSQQDALPSRPSLQQFMEVAKQDNPDVPDKDLRRYWAQNYSDIDPKTLPSLETFLAAAKEDNPGVPDQALKAYWNENYGDFGAAEKDTHLGIGGTIWEGAKSAGRSLKATGQALIGDEAGVVDTANAQQSAPRDIALQNLLTDIQKRKDSLGKDPSWLATIGELGKAALSNPKGTGLLLAEQLPNSAVALGSGLAGAAAGSALGPIGTIAGGIAGLFAANTALETGGKVIEAGADQSFTPEDRSRTLQEGLTKGAVITGVDVASLGLTNFITGTTARAVERATVKTLTDAGVDVTDRAAVMAATKNPDIFSAVQSAQQRAQVASNALGQRLARGSGAVGAEAIGEGAGEYLGEYAATGEADKMEAVIEAFAGLGQSAGEIAATHGLNRKREASALLQGSVPPPIESIPNQIGVGNPTVSIEQAIKNATDILSAPVSSTRQQEDALSSRLAQLADSTVAQREADRIESERQLQSGERLPSAQEAAMQADGIPRTGQDIPLLEGQQPSPSTLPIAEPSRLWMDEAVVPGVEPGQAFTPRASSEPDAKARLQAERERLLSMRKTPSAPSDMAQPVMSESPAQSDIPLQSAADLAYPPSERGRMPTQEELALRDRGPAKRAAQQVPLIEGGEGDTTSTIIPGATFSPRQEPVLTPKERLAAEREKLVRMKATRPAPMPSEPTVPPSSTTSDAPLRSAVDRAYPSVSELHDLARDKGFDVESPVFKTLTKMSTGKTHLDELSPSARDRFAETLKKLTPRETPTIVESPTKKALAPVQPGSPSSDAVTAPRSALPPEQNAEMLLRAEKANADLESSSEMQDTSLIDFLKSKGGLQDQGGELSTMEVDAQRKAFSKKLIQEKGLTLDQAAELAHEAGYIQDRDIALLLDGIDKEVRGKGQHANWYRELTTGPKPMTREAIDSAVAKIIEDHGVDTGAAVERVKAALLNDGEFDGTQWGEDAASIARGDWPAWIPKPDALPQHGATPQQEPVSASPSTKGTTTTPPQSEAATAPQEEPFTLTQQAAKADKPKPKATQLSIDVPPPTVGERPIIGREVTPEEAPLFSEAAKQPDAQQLDIAQDPEPVAQNATPEVAPSPTEILASALRTAADQIEGKKAEVKTDDGLTGSLFAFDNSPPYEQRPNEPAARNRTLAREALAAFDRIDSVQDSGGVLGRPRRPRTSRPEAERLAGLERAGIRTPAVGISKDLATKGRVDLRGYTVNSMADLAMIAQVFRNPRVETLRFFYVKDGKVVGHEGISSRLPGSSMAFPISSGDLESMTVGERRERQQKAVDDMADRMLRLGADGYYILHNHPSGVSRPSRADVQLTRRFHEELPGLLGHVVIDSNEYSTIDREGSVATERLPEKRDAILEPYRPHPQLGTVIRNPESLAELGKAMQTPEGYVTIVYFSGSDGKTRAIQEIPEALFVNTKEATNFLRGQARAFGAVSTAAYGQAKDEVVKAARELQKNGSLLDMAAVAPNGQVHALTKYGHYMEEGENFGKPEKLIGGTRVNEPDSGYAKTAAFKRWFGKSKVVDKDGKPMVVYHGTDKKFNVFNPQGSKRYTTFGEYAVTTPVSFFTADKKFSKVFGKSSMPVYLRIEKPLNLKEGLWGQDDERVLNIMKEKYGDGVGFTPPEELWEVLDNPEIVGKIQALGYDGVFLVERLREDDGDLRDVYATFTPEQIKSATRNRGTYDAKDPNISHNKNMLEDPSSEEAETIQPAIEGKTPLEAAKYIAENAPSEDYRLIAGMVEKRLDALQKAGMKFTLHVAHENDRVPAALKGTRGMAWLPEQSDTTQVWIQGADVAGYVGMSHETVLHELLHAVTQTAIYMGQQQPNTPIGKSVADLHAVWHEIVKHFNERRQAGTVTPFEQAIFERRSNALTDPGEVISWAFTNRDMQQYLESIPYKKESLWSRFVQAVRSFLGLSPQHDTALSEVLRLGEDLMQPPANQLVHSFRSVWMPEQINQYKGLLNNNRSRPTATAEREVTFDDLNSPNFPGLQPTEPPNLPSRAKFIGDLTGPQEAALARVHGTKETWTDKLNSFKSAWKRELVQGLFDQYAPILDYSKKGYMLSRMAKGGDGTLEALMLYGKPYVDSEGAYRVDYTESGGMQGFSKVLSSLQGEHDRFLEWVAAQRAGRLKSVGLENLYSEADIATLKTLNQGKMPDGASREAAYLKALSQLNEWNDAMVKIGVDSGLISDEAREQFKNVPYVPFYRLQEEGLVTGFGKKPGLVNQYAWKKLKGGTAHLNDDLLANLLQNWSHIITASAKNRAAKETLTAAKQAGVAEEIPSGAPGKGHVHYLENGKEVTFTVSDPALMDAVAALHYAGLGSIGKPFTAMKRALSFAVTVNPAYKIRNLIRDSIQAIGTSDLSYNPIKNMRQGAKATRHEAETRAQLLAGGGMMRFGSMLDGNDTTRTRRLIESGVDPETILSDAGAIEKVWKRLIQPAFQAYQEFGDRGEQMNRAALYEQLLKKGLTHQEASFWARDLMDFSMSGKWAGVRILTQIVPFMNARLQGLYKLGRASRQDYRKLATTLGAVALASIGLMLAYQDDEDWKKREDFDRENYWWFKVGSTAFRLPKPFEIGVVGTIAERSVEYLVSREMTGERFGERLAAVVFSQLSMNPTPQLVKPLMDLYANKDGFTGRPIETMGMERLRKQDRYTDRTSETAKFLGGLGLPDPAQLAMGRWNTLSPVQVDSLVRGYFSWLGSTTMTALDYGIRPMLNRGERPDMTLKEAFLVGNFAESLPNNSSRYMTQFYSQATEIEQAYNSYRDALKRGDTEGAASIMEDERDKLSQYHMVEHVKRQESKLNEQIKLIERSQRMSGEEKRSRIDELQQRKQRLVERVAERQLVAQ